MKLYSSAQHPKQWIAWSPETGWVSFPAVAGGWEQRKPCRGLDPVHLRQVPLRLAQDTGIVGLRDPMGRAA